MRLWSLHPKYLDSQGLVALWREALLARAVLGGRTIGYKHHPQLARFLAHRQPRLAINAYLAAVHAEAVARGYAFDRSKLGPVRALEAIPVTIGQIRHEWRHVLLKFALRSPASLARWQQVGDPDCHPLFAPCPGPIAAWERPAPAANKQPQPKRRGGAA